MLGPRSGPYIEDFRRLGASVRPLNLGSLFSTGKPFGRLRFAMRLIINTFQIIGVMVRFSPDIVYTNTATIVAGAVASWLGRRPHVWHIHENLRHLYENSKTLNIGFVFSLSQLRYLIESLSATVIFVTYLARDSLYPDGVPKNAVVVHNGVRMTDLQRNGLAARLSLDRGLRPGDPRIVFVGALAQRKGVDVLLRALGAILADYPKLQLDLWGQGKEDYIRYLRRLCSELGISEKVNFKGFSDQIPAVLSNYSIAVMPSRAESFGLGVLEAMAAGVPVVTTRCGGPEEFIQDGMTGYVVNPEDVAELSEAMRKVLADPERARAMAREARRKVAIDFDLESKLDDILTQLRSVA